MPTEATYGAAMAGFERRAGAGPPCMEGAERAFARIAKTGPSPGTALRQRQAVGYAHAGMWQKAYDLFGPVLAEKAQLSARDWKCLIMSQFELGKYAEVKATWLLSTEGRNISPSYIAFEYAHKAANLLEDADWALQLRKEARKRGRVSADLDHLVVEVLLKAGRLEETRSILKEWETPVLRTPKLRALQRTYEVALATCEERGDAQMALRFLDGMRSATPPYMPNASCPSFVFMLKALRDNDRAEEVKPFFDDVCAAVRESAGESAAVSCECLTVLAEADALCHGRAASSEPTSSSTEAGIETDFAGEDSADAEPSQADEAAREAREGDAGKASSPKADEFP